MSAPRKRVDRVVGHESGGDEVVRALDVEVVDRAIELDALDRLDDVVAAVLGEHRHAGRTDAAVMNGSEFFMPATGAPSRAA